MSSFSSTLLAARYVRLGVKPYSLETRTAHSAAVRVWAAEARLQAPIARAPRVTLQLLMSATFHRRHSREGVPNGPHDQLGLVCLNEVTAPLRSSQLPCWRAGGEVLLKAPPQCSHLGDRSLRQAQLGPLRQGPSLLQDDQRSFCFPLQELAVTQETQIPASSRIPPRTSVLRIDQRGGNGGKPPDLFLVRGIDQDESADPLGKASGEHSRMDAANRMTDQKVGRLFPRLA